jgi:thiosulfate/3-mercaptopyruvate sulfurtransferase
MKRTVLLAVLMLSSVVLAQTQYEFADLEKIDKPVQVIDVRPLDAKPDAWLNAARLPLAKVACTKDGVPFQLPEMKVIKDAFIGLDPALPTMVLGSDKTPESYMDVSRVAYVMEMVGFKKILVLRTGIESVNVEAAKKLAIVGPKTEPNDKIAEPQHPSSYADMNEVRQILKDKSKQLLDVRPAEVYLGASKRDFIARAGHIPTARNAPYSIYFEKKGESFHWRTPEELKKIIESLGFEPAKGPVSYCNTGREASLGYMMLRLSGFDGAKLYDGSSAEWSKDANNPLVTYKWE